MNAIYTRVMNEQNYQMPPVGQRGKVEKSEGFYNPQSIDFQTYLFFPASDPATGYYASEDDFEVDDDEPLTDEGWYEHKCTCQSCDNVFAVRWHEDINDYVVSNCPACGQKYDEYDLWVKQQQAYADEF